MKDKSITRFLGDIKPIKNYERYYVSKLGHVFTIGRTSQLKEIAPCKTPKGYLKVWLYKNGKRKMFYIHRLVAQAFLENPEAFPMVNHKDFDKTNNDVDNLEYCTARYNVIYSAIAKKTSSEYLGVTWNKSVRKWQAQYQIGKKKIYIGCFDTQEEASSNTNTNNIKRDKHLLEVDKLKYDEKKLIAEVIQTEEKNELVKFTNEISYKTEIIKLILSENSLTIKETISALDFFSTVFASSFDRTFVTNGTF